MGDGVAGPPPGHADPAASLAARARLALDAVGEDPARALAAADAVVADVPSRGPASAAGAVAVAHRAAGLALRELGRPVEAERRLRAGVALAERAGDVVTAAEARMSLAYVLLERGRARAALTAADRAAPALRGVRAARLRAQRAMILQRCGHDDEALAEYAAALPVLARAGDAAWESRLRNNRALLRAYRGDAEGAAADLRRAYDLEAGAGRRAAAADRLCNLAWAQGVAGDVAAALATFDRVELEDADVAPPERWVDRAEVLLRAGLVDDARRVAEAAVGWLAGRGWDALAAEATVLLAGCDLRAGEPAAAVVHADEARALLRGQGRRGWTVLTDEVTARASLLLAAARGQDDGAAAVRAATRVADALDAAGWRARADDLRLAAARLALGSGRTALARGALRPVAERRPRGPAADRCRALLARAWLTTEPPQRSRLLRRAWQAAEEERWTVGAAELRAVAAPLAADVVATATADAWRRGDATAVFAWTERGRSALLRQPAVRPPRDADLAAALGRLRLAVHDEERSRLTGQADPAASRLRASLERQVVQLSRHTRGGQASAPVGARDVRERLDGRAFVQYLVVADRIAAVVVTGRGVVVRDLAAVDDVAPAVTAAGFALRRAAGGHRDRAAAAVARGREAAARLDALLGAPLRRDVGEASALVVSPPPLLAEVPWSWLPTCRGRPVSVAPSATSWLAASSRPRRRSRVLAVAGPGLPGARREAEQVAARHPGATLLVAEAASAAAVLGALPDADVAHLAAHGRLRADNPLFSTVECADGPVTGYDLERLARVPHTVLLPACRSGVGRAPLAEETLGLAWTLLGAGASCVVATLVPLADEAALGLMVTTHDRLASGATAAEALATAQADVDPGDPLAAGTAAAFVCYGA